MVSAADYVLLICWCVRTLFVSEAEHHLFQEIMDVLLIVQAFKGAVPVLLSNFVGCYG